MQVLTNHHSSRSCLQQHRARGTGTSRAAVAHRIPQQQRAATRRLVPAQASKDKRTTGNAALDNALDVGGNLISSAADLVPDSVPRGVAKGGVAVVGVLAVFWVLQKLVSTVLTIALLGGAAWFYFQYGGSSGSSDSGKPSGSSSSRKDVDLNDPLAEARRIMDKYKK